MYRKKYKGNNHKVIEKIEAIEKEIFVAKKRKNKFRLTGKFLFLIGGFVLIGLGLFFYKRNNLLIIKENELKVLKEQEVQVQAKEVNKIEESKPQLKILINPMQAAVLKDELFKININLNNNDFSGGDILLSYDSTSLEFKKIGFEGISFDSNKFIKNIGEIEIKRDKILDDNFDLFFRSLNEGMTRMKIKFEDIEKEVLINVLKVEAEKPQVVCSQTILESPYITDIISGPELGTATIYWVSKNMGSKIKVFYGQESGKYNFGEVFVEDNGEFVVKNLKPGENYYFVLQRYDNCNESSLSQEMFVKAGYGILTKGNIRQDLDLPVSYELIP